MAIMDFPTFSRHTIILTNSPGRLELFGAEITMRPHETASELCDLSR